MFVVSFTPQELFSSQQPDLKHYIFHCLTRTGIFMGAFVAGWSKEFHSKERLQHRSIGYNLDRYKCRIQVPKHSVHKLESHMTVENILTPITNFAKLFRESVGICVKTIYFTNINIIC